MPIWHHNCALSQCLITTVLSGVQAREFTPFGYGYDNHSGIQHTRNLQFAVSIRAAFVKTTDVSSAVLVLLGPGWTLARCAWLVLGRFHKVTIRWERACGGMRAVIARPSARRGSLVAMCPMGTGLPTGNRGPSHGACSQKPPPLMGAQYQIK